MKNAQAVLVVSFGTTHLDTLKKNISAIEQAIGEAFPNSTIRRAFTSSVILRKLQTEEHLRIDDVPQALARLEAEGYRHVVIQPTHVIRGEEYHKLCCQAFAFASRMDISMGTPLLTSAQDSFDIARAIASEIEPPAPEEVIIFMGHGTAHPTSTAYAPLEYHLHKLGWNQIFVGTVEGYPKLPQIITQIKKCPQIRRVRLYPLLVVAGKHIKKDMAGPAENSWSSQLEAHGYKVSCVLRGLGEYANIRRLFAQHAQMAQPLQCCQQAENTKESC